VTRPKSSVAPALSSRWGERDELDWNATVRYNTVEMIASDTTSTMRRVLLVEDDEILRRNYAALLGAHRLAVCACAGKSEAMAAFKREAFDVVVLDVSLGDEYKAGFDLCQRFREQRKTTPIIANAMRTPTGSVVCGSELMTISAKRSPAHFLSPESMRLFGASRRCSPAPMKLRRRLPRDQARAYVSMNAFRWLIGWNRRWILH
jgi:Response regulator receiver domain